MRCKWVTLNDTVNHELCQFEKRCYYEIWKTSNLAADGANRDAVTFALCFKWKAFLCNFHRGIDLFFSCIPSQVFEVKHSDPACSRTASADEPLSARSGQPHSFSPPDALCLCRSPAEMKRPLLALWSRNQSRPLCRQAWEGSVRDTNGGGFKGLYHLQKLTTVNPSRDNCLWLSPCRLVSNSGYLPRLTHAKGCLALITVAGRGDSADTRFTRQHWEEENSTSCTLPWINSVLHCECSYWQSTSSYACTWFSEFWWNLQTPPLFFVTVWLKPLSKSR